MANQLPISPYFAGRTKELALLHEAFQHAREDHDARLVWIGGEAGVGKSRLVREFLKQAQGSALCLVGVSIAQTESGLPYAPFTGALRHLIREQGLDSITKKLGFSYTNALALLLPEFGEFPVGDPALIRARMFEAVRKLFEVVSTARPVVLVLEDLHWSDAGSRDLLRFLANSTTGNRLLIVATYRPDSDEGATVGALVAEHTRLDRAQSILLPRLTRREVSDQLEGLLGYLPPGELVSEVFRRGAGVPLFTEAMIDPHGRLRDKLPESVRGLLSSSLDELPPETIRLLEAMAIGGLSVSPYVLAGVLGIAHDDVGRIARPAIDARVLSVNEGSLAFRHALLRDAVSDRMLASDAAQIHAAYANTMLVDTFVCPATWISMALAQHWRHAGQHTKAVQAAWQAAQEARSRYAYGEQLQMLELVLELWESVENPEALLGTSHLDVLEVAADSACWVAESSRGMSYVTRALADLDEQLEPRKVVALLFHRAMLRQQLLVPGEQEDLRRAVALAQEPDALRAEALGQLYRALVFGGELGELSSLAKELVAISKSIDSQEFSLEGAMASAHLEALSGGTILDLKRLIQRAKETDFARLEIIGYAEASHALYSTARYKECIEVGLIAVERASSVGQARYLGPMLAHFLASSMIELGQWDDAERVLDTALDLSPAPLGRVQLLLCVARIACARGRETVVKHILQEIRALDGTSPRHNMRAWARTQLEIELALLTGDVGTAEAVAAAIPAFLDGELSPQVLPLLCTAAKASKTQIKLLNELLRIAAPFLEGPASSSPYAQLLVAECHSGKAAESLTLWRGAAEAFAASGYPFQEAYCCYRFALRVADGGRRTEATEAVKRAAALCRLLGCEPLLEAISELAQRVRVKLPGAAETECDSQYELTERELQVLKLLALGKRNREIAKDLYISPKTAGVHVSNILAKLNVKTRGAAAAVAHRLQMVQSP